LNKILSCTIFFVLSCLNLYAQKAYKFELSLPQTKVAGSLYNSITVVDFRGDTNSMGFIHSGLTDRYAKVVPATSMKSQYKALFNAVTDSTAANGKLLLLIERLLFAERENALTTDGYFSMRANLYARIANHYQMIRTIDTVVRKTSMDPTKAMLKAGNEVMTGFLTKNLTATPSGSIYLSYDILNIITTEKYETALYSARRYTDGLYLTYKAFKNQMPDRQIIVDSADINTGNIRTIEGGGITLKVKASNVYALVYNGHPYVVSEGHYYPLTKKDNDFFFVGKARYTLIRGDELVSDMVGEPSGNIIFGAPSGMFEIKLDYKNGAFIRLRKLPDVKAGTDTGK